ncbi:hypothetical protein OG401_21955 [Kitasatospora purpeofusca]|uniref:hypothetical protein n=1 Tax=Kitasatospora purpeofusca TaxID=67352 RepID=UPI0022573AEE|nr:hypothetical protein [Kitasatospora purpeofusca]MCX4686937.1 hypothetical protein [Kitasatospora purpeofusca]
MSDPQTPTLVEVTAVPQPPAPADAGAKTPPAAPSGAVPGVPLAVAVANALGGTVVGALALGGPVTLAVAGTAAGAAAIGGLARRARTARRTTPQTTLHRAAAQRSAAPGGLFAPPPPRRTPRAATGTNSAAGRAGYGQSGVRPSGRGGAPVAVVGHRSAGLAPSPSASRKGPAPMAMGRTVGTSSTARRTAPGAAGGGPVPGKQRTSAGRSGGTGGGPRRVSSGAAHTLAKAAGRRIGGAGHAAGAGPMGGGSAGRRDARLAKVAERSARRVAKGQAKAERAAGIDPATGAGTGVSRGAGASLGHGGVSPVQAKALRRSAMRHRTRMAGAAVATGLVGLASAGAFNWRHKGKVAGHMRRVWTRMAARARAVRDARDAAIRGTNNPAAPGSAGGPAVGQLPDVPVPAQHVNVPGRPTPGSADGPVFEVFGRPSRPDRTPFVVPIALGKSTVKEPTTVSDQQLGGTAATFSLSSAADVLLQAATTFDPETMLEFLALADDLPVAFGTIQEVLRVLTEKGAEQLPLDPVVPEEIAEGYRAMGKVVQALEEVGATFRRAHAEDLERHENPRNGLEAERKWNV